MFDSSLWRLTHPRHPGSVLECAMVSCCAGAELQLLRADTSSDDLVIVLRELYPTKGDLDDRARMLKAEYEAAGYATAETECDEPRGL
jgi:hypothetical protein